MSSKTNSIMTGKSLTFSYPATPEGCREYFKKAQSEMSDLLAQCSEILAHSQELPSVLIIQHISSNGFGFHLEADPAIRDLGIVGLEQVGAAESAIVKQLVCGSKLGGKKNTGQRNQRSVLKTEHIQHVVDITPTP
jgi:hypothetical protein